MNLGDADLLLQTLELIRFRNFAEAAFGFPSARAFITGDNGRGKSNLLEAIHFLSVGKSGRGAKDREALRRGGEDFSIRASLSGDQGGLTLRLYYHPHLGKKAFIDQNALPKLSDLVGLFPSVLFSPEDVDLTLRFPAQRRRMLDMLISQASPAYLSDLQEYRRALMQRNSVLRARLREKGRDEALLEAWDEEVAALGTRIIRRRLEVVEEITAPLLRFYRDLCAGGETLTLSYESTVPPIPSDGIERAFVDALRRGRRREFLFGHTLYGPHRDNLCLRIDGEDVQTYASQGQLKSILLSWKFAEAVFLEGRTGHKPLLLLDDAFSELDARRSLFVLGLLDGFGQVFLTSARDPDLPIRERGFEEIHLEEGKSVYP